MNMRYYLKDFMLNLLGIHHKKVVLGLKDRIHSSKYIKLGQLKVILLLEYIEHIYSQRNRQLFQQFILGILTRKVLNNNNFQLLGRVYYLMVKHI